MTWSQFFDILPSILFIALIISFGFIFYNLYLWTRRNRYTRERFAFVALGPLSRSRWYS